MLLVCIQPATFCHFQQTTVLNNTMQAAGGQRREEYLQLGRACNLPPGTEVIVPAGTITSGFRPPSGKTAIARVRIRFADGTVFQSDVGAAVAHAASRGYTNVNFGPYFRRLNAGEEVLGTAHALGLPFGFAVRRDRDDAGVIVSVSIWTPEAEFLKGYHHLASYGINTREIQCEYWQSLLHNAEEAHLPAGWAASLNQTGSVNCIYDPNGNTYFRLVNAWLATGVVLHPDVVVAVVEDYRRIALGNLSNKAAYTVIGDLVDFGWQRIRRFLTGGSRSTPGTLYSLHSLFCIHNTSNSNTLLQAAVDAGGVQNITQYEQQMATAMQSRRVRGLYNPRAPPSPDIRADTPTNQYGLRVVAEVDANHVAQDLGPLFEENDAAAIGFVGVPLNQNGLPLLQAEVHIDPPQDDADNVVEV